MKFTLSWLKEHLDTKASLDEILEGLIGVGLEVEEVQDQSKELAAFKVAYVLEAEKHPNADKLKLCKVETDQGIKQVVCGAPNARAGMKAIIAQPGVVIPVNGTVFAPATIRGVESQAMMCSERELKLSEEHDGIIEVQGDWPVGTPAAVALGLDDPMIYIKVTANRPDALGVHGLARDLAAKGLGTLKPIKADPVKGTFKSPIGVKLSSEDGNSCKLFVGRYFKGVKNGPSPKWLQQRLTAIGLRPISVLVDITNFMTFAYGRPLHVFDADKVTGNVGARLAKDGETILALDGKTYTLNSSMTVIADDAHAEGIAGIMGGEASGCSDTTNNVFLEAAYFDPRLTAAAGRKLGIHSDARYRFERGVDPAFTQVGAEIATRMILELCGGKASELVIAGAVPDTSRSFTLRKSRVKSLGGVDIAWDEQLHILRDLGFTTSQDGVAQVPSWRPDVHGEADLVEEVCRIHGLDNVPPAAMSRPHDIARPILNPLQKRMLASRRMLATRGFNECATWAFLTEAQSALFGGGKPELKLANPISSELSDMRPSLLPNLIAAAGRNAARGFGDVQLAEVGHAYAGDKMADETLRAGGVRRGDAISRSVQGGARVVDAFDAKADALAVIEACGLAASTLQVVQGAPAWFHPGRSGTIQMGPQNKLAYFGEIHPKVLQAMDVKGPLVAFEVILNALPASKQKGASRAALSISDLLPVSRDFAFVVEDKVQAAELIKAVKGVDKVMITDAAVFDVYKLEGGKKSLAVEVTLQPKEKTFTEEDIAAISAKIVATAQKAVGATLRG
ncbi:phenylalanine--tRNA ligase subunit beta [Aestuariivirga litoralis]|uniref:phenylalanine--tRNA ligase subunit beta n=1 Tax=Aestuariivirga litoralis TaxID=2650924 RepID=UPI0018C66B88|nr:phenylalanine--tRNA ligase subunit beta [Aestuariivirga litoralis]MBG1232927.1 phenylalanine--tRNA ligase subunit beta [Aestuariivirga litoralis]